MSTFYSYENQHAQFIIKALTHYREKAETQALTPHDNAYSISLAYGVFLPAKNPISHIIRLLREAKRLNNDFGAINLFFAQGTDELLTKDLDMLAHFAAAVTVFAADTATNNSNYSPDRGSMYDLIDIQRILVRDLKKQVGRRKGIVVQSFVSDAEIGGDFDESPSYIYRFQMALALLCGNHLPDERLCRQWLDGKDEKKYIELQDWAVSHSTLNWAMGIGVIEAAMTLADNPNEGGNHPMDV